MCKGMRIGRVVAMDMCKGMRIGRGGIAHRQSWLCFTDFAPMGASGSVRLAPTVTCHSEVQQAAPAQIVVPFRHGAMTDHVDVADTAFTPCHVSRDASAAAFEVLGSGMVHRVQHGAVLAHAALLEALSGRRRRVNHRRAGTTRHGHPRAVAARSANRIGQIDLMMMRVGLWVHEYMTLPHFSVFLMGKGIETIYC